MSTFLASARARARRPVTSLPRPRLTVVPKVAGRAPRVPFVILVVGLIVSGLVGLLVLNTSLQRGAYVTTDLEGKRADLVVAKQQLQLDIAELSASQRVAQEAQRLGMVPNDSPVFLALATGSVIGKARPGDASKQADIRTTSTPARARTGKVASDDPVAGATLTTGPVEVAEPKPDRDRQQQRRTEQGSAGSDD